MTSRASGSKLAPAFVVEFLSLLVMQVGANPSLALVTRPGGASSGGTSTGPSTDSTAGFGSTLMPIGDLQTTEMPTIFTYTEHPVFINGKTTSPSATQGTPATVPAPTQRPMYQWVEVIFSN